VTHEEQAVTMPLVPAEPAMEPVVAEQTTGGPDTTGRPAPANSGSAAAAFIRGWLASPTGPARMRDVAVGTAVEVEEAAALLLAGLRRGAAEPRRHLRQQLSTAGDLIGRRVAGLAERGAAERVRARQRAGAALDSAVTAIATFPLVDRVVDAQLERVLWPTVGAVLDDVLARLENDPERVRGLIRGQRETMVDEVVGRLRTGAEAGDTAVDRLTSRMLRRDRPTVPGPYVERP